MQQPQDQLYAPVSRKGQEMIRAATLNSWDELRDLLCSIVNVKDDFDGLHNAIERFAATMSDPLHFDC